MMTIMVTGTTMATITVLEGTATGTICLKEKLRPRLLLVSQVFLLGYLAKNNQVNKKDTFSKKVFEP